MPSVFLWPPIVPPSCSRTRPDPLDRPSTVEVVTATRPVRLGDVARHRHSTRRPLLAFSRTCADTMTPTVVRRTLTTDGRAPHVGRGPQRRIVSSSSWPRSVPVAAAAGPNGAPRSPATGALRSRPSSLWIRIDPASGRPTALGDEFTGTCTVRARRSTRVDAGSSSRVPPAHAERRSWLIRRVDLDPLRHVNNAVHWAVVEETLPDGPRRGRGEVEYLAPRRSRRHRSISLTSISDRGDVSSWLVADDAVVTAARWTPAP